MQLKRPQVELALGIAGFRTLLLCGAILFRLCAKERELDGASATSQVQAWCGSVHASFFSVLQVKFVNELQGSLTSLVWVTHLSQSNRCG